MRIRIHNTGFLLVSWKPLTKKAGSRSVIQCVWIRNKCHGSGTLAPDRNSEEPMHCGSSASPAESPGTTSYESRRCTQCWGSGSGIRCLFDPWIRNGFFPDPRSRIPDPKPIFLRGYGSDKFLGKKFCNSLKIGPNFFLQHFKNKIIYNFAKFAATKKGWTNKFFIPLSLVAVLGSGIRDPGSGIRNPGWLKIRIRDSG